MASHRFEFGQFVLDLERFELTRDGVALHLERIPMSLLILLVRGNGRLIGRQEIIDQLWGNGLHFDTDNSINTAVRKIRHALGDDPADPRFVETVLGKGYRFKGIRVACARPEVVQSQSQDRVMLAVLPFENLSGDPAQEYFSDGVTEETIMRLGQMSPHRLGVIARTSSMTYKQTKKSVAQIGRELTVNYVVEGSIRRDAERIRITAQLVRVQDQMQLWADSYDRRLPGLLDIHGEIGAAIAAQVNLKLLQNEKQQLVRNQPRIPEALEHYLYGRYHHARSNLIDLQKAVEYFKKATELDPSYALAHSGLAESLIVLPISGDVNPKDVCPTGKTAATRAVHLDPDSAETQTADARVKFWYDWDFDGAEAAARRAIQLNENYAPAHMSLAHVLSNIGCHEEALSVIRQALVLDPFALIYGAMYGQILYHAGKYHESVQQLRATLNMEPRFWVGQICAAKVYERLGMHAAALAACDRAWEYSSGNTEALSLAGYVHAFTGNRLKAHAKIDHMSRIRENRYVPSYNLALVHVGLGENETALQLLEQAFGERDAHMPFLLDHKWDSLRSTPRFRKLLSRVGFRADSRAFSKSARAD